MTLKVGVIGVGMIGQDHIRRLTRVLSGAAVVAVTDVDLAVAKNVADGVPGATLHKTGEDLIADDEVEAVVVCSWGETHEQYVLACIAAGKPVFCEKPLATTQEACERIISAETGAGRRLVQVGYMRRYDAAYRALREVVHGGTIGLPLLMHCTHRNPSVPGYYKKESAITDTAVHEIDLVRWLFDEEIVATTVLVPRKSRNGGELQDPLLLLLEMESGILVDVEISVNIRYGYDIRGEVVAENGTVALGDASPVRVRSDAPFRPGPGRLARALHPRPTTWSSRSGSTRGRQRRRARAEQLGRLCRCRGLRRRLGGHAVRIAHNSQRRANPTLLAPDQPDRSRQRQMPAPRNRRTIVKLALDPYMFRSTPLIELPGVVADLGYEYIELSPREDFTPFFLHPRANRDVVTRFKAALDVAGVKVATHLPLYRWSGPDEDERQAAVRYWKRAIELTVELDCQVMNSEFNGRPEQASRSEAQFWRSMEELLPVFEREGVELRLEPHPDDFVEDGKVAVDMIRGINSPLVSFLYCAPHTFHQGGDIAGIMEYAGDLLPPTCTWPTRSTTARRPACATSSTRPGRPRASTSTSTSARARSTGTSSSERSAGLSSTAS